MHMNGYCVFYPLEIEDVQTVIISPDEQDEGYAVHFEKKCNAMAPINGHVESKVNFIRLKDS